jgi:L-lactate dehydrogenase complex protein LldG
MAPLPVVVPPAPPTALMEAFCQQVERIGGRVVRDCTFADLETVIGQLLGLQKYYVSSVPGLSTPSEASEHATRGQELANVELALCTGIVGVAENGAIWVSDEQLPHRALPFLCQHLGLVLPESALVATMHEAYQQLDGADVDYGVFIAGPSKTADIEQSLVIGAHGPRSLTVYLLSESR